MADIWSEALHSLQPRLGAQTFDMWLRPIALQEIRGRSLHLHAPNRFMKEWFENHYLSVVLDEIKRMTHSDYTAEIEVQEQAAANTPRRAPTEPVAAVEVPAQPAPQPTKPPVSTLRPRLSARYR